MNDNQYGINNPSYKHGECNTRLYKIHHGIKNRCLTKKHASYSNYGGRGITICDEWLEFIPFRDWSLNNGYADNLVIDRIENNGNYEPSNCHWITMKESNRKKRNIKLNMIKAKEIRIKFNSGYYTKRALAKEYNTSERNIKNVTDNISWKEENH